MTLITTLVLLSLTNVAKEADDLVSQGFRNILVSLVLSSANVNMDRILSIKSLIYLDAIIIFLMRTL